jgi:hypothetical protein
MYAVAFDLVVADAEKYHPKGVSQAYTEIGAVLGEGMAFTVFKAVCTSQKMKTWRFCLWPFRGCARGNGFKNPCGTFGPFALNNGPILPPL